MSASLECKGSTLRALVHQEAMSSSPVLCVIQALSRQLLSLLISMVPPAHPLLLIPGMDHRCQDKMGNSNEASVLQCNPVPLMYELESLLSIFLVPNTTELPS